MRVFPFALGILGTALLVLIVWRAARERSIARFPLFYSYVVYVLCGSTTVFITSRFFSSLHWMMYWRYFLVSLVAEFGVLVEISDHIFNPFPAIRRLGRVVNVFVCVVFSMFILPALFRPESPTLALFGFGEMTSISKAAIICLLLATARYYRLPLGRNVSGMLLGFSVYVGISVANFALAERLGRALYGTTFSLLVPLGCTLCFLIWAVALWRYEPVVVQPPAARAGEHASSESLTYRLERFNSTLGSLLRK